MHEAVKLTSQLMTKVMLPTLKSVMEKEKKVKHKAVCDRIEGALEDLEKYRIKVADGSECQFLVNPVMQSGGSYTMDVLKAKVYVPARGLAMRGDADDTDGRCRKARAQRLLRREPDGGGGVHRSVVGSPAACA